MMAPYAQYYYDSHDRTGGISFIVAALSPTALTAVWNKIKKLQSLLGPVVTADTPGAIRVKSTTLKLGDIFNNTAIIIDSLNFDIDTETDEEKANVRNQYQMLVQTFSNLVMFVDKSYKNKNNNNIIIKKQSMTEILEEEEEPECSRSGVEQRR
jgi:hypothetical protein